MAILEESPNGEETGERMILRNMIHWRKKMQRIDKGI